MTTAKLKSGRLKNDSPTLEHPHNRLHC